MALAALATTVAVAFSAVPPAQADPADPWMDTRLSSDQRAALVLAEMTLEQKVALLVQTGGQGVPELGIPAIRGKDASNGVNLPLGSTALPVGVALASTFDDRLAVEYGAVGAREARAAGHNSVAAPSLDLARTPWNGRLWESTGEDPLLTGRIASGQTNGIQGEDVPAEAKHYNVYHQETRRGHVDAVLDERTLQEVYTRPWEKLVDEANPSSVMCSFNKVNGEFGCGSRLLLTTILKEQLGFKGYVQTDFNAAHGFDDYAAGMDTSGEQLTFSGANLEQAVLDGRVEEARVTDAVRRVLWSMFEFGIIDNPPVGSFVNPMPAAQALPQSMIEAGNRVATEVGAKGTVLLKNDARQLPLGGDVRSIAVIGSDADHYIDGGGSAAVATPTRLTTILDGLTARAGSGTTVRHAAGTDPVSTGDTLAGPAPIPSSVLTGVRASYHRGINSQATPAWTTREEKQINLRAGLSNDTVNTSQVRGLPWPLPVEPMSVRWTATLSAPATGSYGLSLTHLGTARLYLDGELVLEGDASGYATDTVQVDLVEGRPVDVRVDYTTDDPNQFDGGLNDQPGAMVRLGWTPPADVLSPQVREAVELARDSEVAVVVARDYTGEAADRADLTLPQDQDRLIREVAAVNPRTVVVLATSGAVLMPWLDQVPAVVEAWYGGQTQGTSVAAVLYGDVNPSGRLPITFPASEDQPQEMGVASPFADVDELSPTTTYDDGIHIGYRGYAKAGLEPLFPFGHGLSYSRFDYAKLKTKDVKVADATKPRGRDRQPRGLQASVSVEVTNTSRVAGSDVVQVYVGTLPTAQDTPVRQLAGYARVDLQPGRKGKVEVALDDRSLQYWDERADRWVTPTGTVAVYVGGSAAEARLAGSITLR
ncbi:beta-glucosidase [Auraticoccus monumenti]|uniref:Beta-glucosidase n=1 Tax=Auraticoccus monumenti TaxID=675864 RepID=A0A1G6WI90_9ACTN|nr:beta-glucosidase [Auraticoccus monumenti]